MSKRAIRITCAVIALPILLFGCIQLIPAWSFQTNPPGKLVSMDTVRDRRHLNFSEWGSARGGERSSSREAAEAVAQGSMPPALYVMLQPDASLAASEKQSLAHGLQATLK